MIILFSASSPSRIADELSCLGLRVKEAIAISEVFNLVEQHPEAHIVITPNVDSARAKIVQEHYPTLTLNSDTPTEEILWELSAFCCTGIIQ